MSETNPKTARLLVVDDEEIVVSLVRDALEEDGLAVHTAESGTEALSILRESSFDLIISDIRMPHMDGIELVQKAQEIHPNIGIIFMTGYANLQTAKDAMKQGAFDYIMKPFELTEIRHAVTNALERRAEVHEKTSESQLERVSSLSQMLVAAGDRDSLLDASVQYAMMQCGVDCGTIIYWGPEKAAITVVNAEHGRIERNQTTCPECLNYLEHMNMRTLIEPRYVSSLCPGGATDCPQQMKEMPPWQSPDTIMAAIALTSANQEYGLLLLGPFTEESKLKPADLKLLGITAAQLAISLENVQLLEETRRAYGRLKELQDETIQLEKMATRGEMSAEIGHELNNFLGVVAGNLSMLEHKLAKGQTDSLDKHLTATIDTVEKIKQFTANLMDLTPIASKKEILDFDKLLAEVVDYLRPQKRFRGVKIELESTGEQIPFEADSTHVQQLLYNLFNNAADATLEADTRSITARAQTTSNDRFTFSITDTGVGIEPDKLSKAFNERFTTKKHGHGFGLVVCKRIIESHGGVLHIDSKPGHGTTITIDFPLVGETTEDRTPTSKIKIQSR